MRREYYPPRGQLRRSPWRGGGRQGSHQAGVPGGQRGGDGEVVYLSPAAATSPSPDGRWTAARAITSPADARRDLESFHPFESRVDPSRPGYLLFSSSTRPGRAHHLGPGEEPSWPGGISSTSWCRSSRPHWRPDRQSVIFSGLAVSGVSDLYRVAFPEVSWRSSPTTSTRISIPAQSRRRPDRLRLRPDRGRSRRAPSTCFCSISNRGGSAS